MVLCGKGFTSKNVTFTHSCPPLIPASSKPARRNRSTARLSGSCAKLDATWPNTAPCANNIRSSRSAKPELAAEVTITAAEAIGVDAAIIFADLLLPLEVMACPSASKAGEGPVIEKPVREPKDITRLRTDQAADLGYVAEAIRIVCKHFGDKAANDRLLRRAPFTLASYMIEGGGSRNYVHTKR